MVEEEFLISPYFLFQVKFTPKPPKGGLRSYLKNLIPPGGLGGKKTEVSAMQESKMV